MQYVVTADRVSRWSCNNLCVSIARRDPALLPPTPCVVSPAYQPWQLLWVCGRLCVHSGCSWWHLSCSVCWWMQILPVSSLRVYQVNVFIRITQDKILTLNRTFNCSWRLHQCDVMPPRWCWRQMRMLSAFLRLCLPLHWWSQLNQPLFYDVIPDRGQVVSSILSVKWRFQGPDVDCLLHSPFKPFLFHKRYLSVLQCDGVFGAFSVYVFWDLWCGGTLSPLFSKSYLQWTFGFIMRPQLPDIYMIILKYLLNFVFWAVLKCLC